MAIELDFDPISSESRDKEKPVPVHQGKPEKGVVLVKLRDIPRGRYAALISAYQSAVGVLSKVMSMEVEQTEALLLTKFTIDELAAAATVEVINVKQLSSAWQLLFIARRELVLWGIVSHNPDSFKTKKKEGEGTTPTPFESVTENWEGVNYQLASNRMIALYSHPQVGILGNLSNAVRAFNEDRWQSPEEIWASTKEQADKAKKAGEAKARPPKKGAKK